MSKKIKKLAVIRSDLEGGSSCPFGLPISSACKTVGETIYKMAPLSILGDESTEEEEEELSAANQHLYRWNLENKRCPYAGKLFPDNQGVVECNWGSNAPGVNNQPALRGSSFFYRPFNGTGLDGLYSIPLGYYTNNSIDIGYYYGPFSFEATASKEKDEEK